MNKNSNADSILQGNFCDIVNYFRGSSCDDADQLAQRALTIVLLTNHLVQTGYEVDADPFMANMAASTALGLISQTIKRYPFVSIPAHRADVTLCKSDAEREAILDSAEDMVEMAERLLPSSRWLALRAQSPLFQREHSGTALTPVVDERDPHRYRFLG
jgi:hypothetical protein